MAKLTVVNPVARPLTRRYPRALREPSLAGKRVGLYWNLKSGGDVALERAGELIAARFADVRLYRFEGSVGFLMRHATAADAERIAAACDVVIGATAD